MDINQIEKIYEANGLDDYLLTDTNDILKCHGINFMEVPGYDELDDFNKKIFKNFIVNYYNARGLEYRSEINPTGIYFVEHIHYSAKDPRFGGEYIGVASTVMSIGKNGIKNILRQWEDKHCKDLKRDKETSEKYLRFEYDHHGKSEWYHVIEGGRKWY